jgi:UDP-N-acetylglucosamine 2-epimerase
MARFTVATIVGARPQFVKAAPLSRAIRRTMREVLIHTGQHYDPELSDRFFEELHIPRPDRNLGVGSGPHGSMTGRMLEALEAALIAIRPDLVVVLGDTNSTLAGALAAAKLQIPVAHVEAGLRSFDDRMPEEINRRVTDHLSQLLFCPTPAAVANLRREGLRLGVHRVGDVMMDAVLSFSARARRRSLRPFGVPRGGFYLATVHRPENTDDPVRLAALMRTLEGLPLPVLLPLHPRTRARLRQARLWPGRAVRVLPPAGYLDTLLLAGHARAVLTDSGGLQKESFILRTPCLTLRDTTEWVETLRTGANRLVGADPRLILSGLRALESRPPRFGKLRVYGDGHAAERIARIVSGFLTKRRAQRRR